MQDIKEKCLLHRSAKKCNCIENKYRLLKNQTLNISQKQTIKNTIDSANNNTTNISNNKLLNDKLIIAKTISNDIKHFDGHQNISINKHIDQYNNSNIGHTASYKNIDKSNIQENTTSQQINTQNSKDLIDIYNKDTLNNNFIKNKIEPNFIKKKI